MLYIVTGGSGSGKSEYAEQTAVQCRNGNGGTLWYLATMRIWDDEGRKRVERHRRMRAAKGFKTIERYTGLETLELEERFEEYNSAGLDDEQENDSLKRWESCRVAQKPVLLLECMSNLVLNEFYAQENGAQERILQGIKHLQNQCHDLIIVTNEIFSDGVTYDLESERYIELLGRINRELGQMADSVTEVVYGIPLAVSTPVFAADENRNPGRTLLRTLRNGLRKKTKRIPEQNQIPVLIQKRAVSKERLPFSSFNSHNVHLRQNRIHTLLKSKLSCIQTQIIIRRITPVPTGKFTIIILLSLIIPAKKLLNLLITAADLLSGLLHTKLPGYELLKYLLITFFKVPLRNSSSLMIA